MIYVWGIMKGVDMKKVFVFIGLKVLEIMSIVGFYLVLTLVSHNILFFLGINPERDSFGFWIGYQIILFIVVALLCFLGYFAKKAIQSNWKWSQKLVSGREKAFTVKIDK